MIDHIEIGTVPANEECAQVGSENYKTLAIIESKVFIDQLERMFPNEVLVGVRFKTSWNDHDFGKYLSIKIVFQDDSSIQSEAAYAIDRSIPENWDHQSILKLSEEPGYKEMLQKRRLVKKEV